MGPRAWSFTAALLFLATSLSCAASAMAATVDLAPSKDNTLIESPPGNSNGAGDGIYVGRVGMLGSGSNRRGVLAFNLSSIPANSTINSVTLTLAMTQSPNDLAASVGAHRLSADWGEQGSTGQGQGAPAQTGDATWTYRFFATVLWALAGGDFAPAASATQTVTDLGNYTWSGAGMVADVQFWVNNPTSNFGWLLMGDESFLQSVKKFDSKEGFTPPSLHVDYSPTTDVGPQAFQAVQFSPPWPSPASGRVNLAYTLPRSARVSLAVHDVTGHMIRHLVAEDSQSPGDHRIVWDGHTESGTPAPSGLYLVRLIVDQKRYFWRIPLVR